MEESHGHDVNSAAGLILMCPKTRRVLLALRSGDEEYQGGTWCTLGGMMQNLERPLEAALREAMEEGESGRDTVYATEDEFFDELGL